MKMFRGLRRVGGVIGAPLIAAVLVFALTGFASNPTPSPKLVLTAGTDFSVTSTITAWPACSGSTVDFYPGVTDCLTYTVTNPLSVAITITSLSATPSAASLPVGCPASLLDLSGADYSGTPTLTIPAGGSGSVSEQLTMQDNGNQDACQGAAVSLDLSGTAQYTDSTTVGLTSSANPSTAGNSVTFTATVTGANPTIDTSPPSGTVDFFSCTDVTCTTATLLGSGTIDTTTGQATFSTAGLPVGSNFVEAIYQGAGTDYAASPASNVVTQIVSSGGGGGGGGSGGNLLTPPTAPAGSTSSASGQGDCSTGVVAVTLGGITVTANCNGALTLALYGSDPVGPATFISAGQYFDVKVAPGSTFSTVTIVDSALNGGTTLLWWNGSAWVAVNPQTGSPGPPPSITAILSATSSPTISQLTGTVFAIGTPGTPPTTTTTAPSIAGGGGTTTTPSATSSTTTTVAGPATKAAGGGSGLAFTGTDVIRLGLSGLAALVTGLGLSATARRRARRSEMTS